MLESEAMATMVQFGVAGLIGWMWVMERRLAGERERQISQTHEMLVQDRQKLDVFTRALEGNTRAITALEVGQRRLVDLIEHRRRRGTDDEGRSAARPGGLEGAHGPPA